LWSNRLSDFFFATLWPGLGAWTLLYISDYAMTVTCARLYQSGVNEKIVIEGSFELTPYFQNDIDRLRSISPRFIAMLLLSSSMLALVWFLEPESSLYEYALGAMLLVELTIHVRHLRNLFSFRAMIRGEAVRGRIEYSRLYILHMSSTELWAFSLLFAFLSLVLQSWFLLGGATSCLVTAIKHRQLARARDGKLASVPQAHNRGSSLPDQLSNP
jgi:hypothetical protein